MVEKIQDLFESIINEGVKDDLFELFNSIKGPLKRLFVVFVLFAGIGWYFSGLLVNFFKSILPSTIQLVAFSPIEVFMSIITVIILFASIFTIPFFLFELIKFVGPALYAKERKALYLLIPVSLVLFICGAIFGLFIMAFFGLIFFAEMGVTYGITNLWSLSNLINTLSFIAFGFGTAFQLPIVMVFLVKVNLIKIEQLVAIRKYIIIILLIVGAILTPPDILSQLLLAGPLYLLYEATLLYLKVSNNNKLK